MRTNDEDALHSRIAQKPKNARATASLACLLVEQARLSDHDGYGKEEAVELALRSIQLQPKKPFGYAALSVAHPNFDERMKALKTAISLSSEDHFMARVGLLSRLLFEPRQEQVRNLPEKIAKASKRHPGRKDLTAAEVTVYETLEKDLIHAYKQATKMDPSGGPLGVLALMDYKLGLFFRKRLPVALHRPRARHHLKRAYSNLPLDHPKKNVTQFWLATLDESTEMTRCPPEYIVSLYSTFSNQFDDLLVGKLAYKTPTVLRQLLNDSVTQKAWDNGLDLGCGTGLSGLAFRDCIVRDLVGVDLSPEMVEKARARGCYDQLLVGDVCDAMTKMDRAFDLIFACDVFVYLGDLSQVFAQVYEALATNGMFVFSTELLVGAASPDIRFQLHECARFAHSQNYIDALARDYRFSIKAVNCCPIRKNQGDQVDGMLVVLQKSRG